MNKLHHHFAPHRHYGPFGEKGQQHQAHLISLPALFAYFQILIVVAASFYFLRIVNPKVLGTITFSAQEIIRLTNLMRQQNGAGTVVENPKLDAAAAAKARNMFAEDYWAHNSPSGKTPWYWINGAGYKYVYAGENLARDFTDAQSVVTAWMNSPSHRSNLLDKNFKDIGVAVASGKLGGREGILVVQEFGQTPQALADNVSVPPAAPESASAKQQQQEPQSAPLEQIQPLKTATVAGKSTVAWPKILTFGLLSFVFVLFAAEVMISLKKSHLSLRSGILAHVAILGFVLLVLWYSTIGAII